MLPASRCEGDLFAIPKFSLDRGDVEGFKDELHGFHEQFQGCFMRSEPRENFFLYMTGQFSTLERKSIEPIALQVEDGNVRAMQRFVSDVVWDEKAMLREYHALVNEDLGDAEGILISGGHHLASQTGHISGEISEDEHNQGRPLLSAIVVNKQTGRPGPGFYALAKQLGKFRGLTDQEEMEFWLKEIKSVHDFWMKKQ